MARKAKKRVTQAPPKRRPSGPGPGAPAANPNPAQSQRLGGDQALVRSVEMSLNPRAAGGGRRARGGLVLESADPAIPLDQVPFFTSDLARLAVVAVVMLALLVAGSQVIPRLVH